MSEDQFSMDDPTMKMGEDGTENPEDQMMGAGGDGGSAEVEGSKIDASKNEEDEG